MYTERLQRWRKRLLRISPQAGPLLRGLNTLGRLLYILGRELRRGTLTLHAMSLVYTTLLSIVPLLALSFSLLKALGMHNSLLPLLDEWLRPLGKQRSLLSAQIIDFVDRMQVGVLGSIGVLLLLYTSLTLVQKIETSFNAIWNVERLRPLPQRIGEYLVLLMFGPLLLFTVVGAATQILSNEWLLQHSRELPVIDAISLSARLLPSALIVLFFSFIYWYIPNTRVRPAAALTGGLLAGISWQAAGLVFARVVSWSTQYNALYSGFAIFAFLLIWLYLNWLVILLGCRIGYAIQHPRDVPALHDLPPLTGRAADELALAAFMLTARRLLHGLQPLTVDQLEAELKVAPRDLRQTLTLLLDQQLLRPAGRDGNGLLPAMDLQSMTLGDLLLRIRSGAERAPLRFAGARAVHRDLDALQRLFSSGPGAQSLRDWLQSSRSE